MQQLEVMKNSIKQQLGDTNKPLNRCDMLKEGTVDAEEGADTNSQNNNRESEAIQQQQNQVEPDIIIIDGNDDNSNDAKAR